MVVTLLLLLGMLQIQQAGPTSAPGHTGGGDGGTSSVPVIAGIVAGLLLLLAVALSLGWLVAGRLLRPLREITETARHICAHDLHLRLSATGRDDELKALADTLDALFSRLEAAFAAQRDFVANAAHELRTPLTATRTVLQVALADPEATAATLREACQTAVALGEDQRRLIESLLTLAESQRGLDRREAVDLTAIARETISARNHAAGQETADRDTAESVTGNGDTAEPDALIVTTGFGTAATTGDSDLVRSLVANLIDNALRHNTPGGYVEVLTESFDDRAVIQVRNSGPVIPPHELERLLLPFQQLDGRRQHSGGHGLGLAIVRAIAVAHDAEIRLQAPPEGGLDIAVLFRNP
ncbi:MAG: HAMP domain-containing protein [Catenulispora sp.]|nr:HAMP domain-containing protein [Catenulispora sp.]